uniref:Uncharacterized protein n=1 Tax=Glossina morsitans morsitans TaxID=37546 RepID=A0A1B0GBV9_GLOMM
MCFKCAHEGGALDKVDSRGFIGAGWGLVELYAQYEPAKLLPLLKRFKHYLIREALDICRIYVNPAGLLDKIWPQNIGLRKSLTQLLCDYRLQVDELKIGNNIQLADYFSMHAARTKPWSRC